MKMKPPRSAKAVPASMLLAADPAFRLWQPSGGAWRIGLGWAAAAILHGGLLAALLFTWPVRLNPPPMPASIALVMLPADRPAARLVSVPPKPPVDIAQKPVAVPVHVANQQADRPLKAVSALPKPAGHPAAVRPLAVAPRDVVQSKPVVQNDDGFAAAQPIGGSVNQPPEYPASAQAHGEQGDVLLSIHVLADGEADSVSVTQSSGYSVLDEAAATAVWKWRFQPSMLAGHAVPSVIPYRITFNLQNAQGAD